MQHAVHSQLVPIAEVARRVGIKSIDVAERYANRGRHQPKLRKLGLSQELATQVGQRPAAGAIDPAPGGAPAPAAVLGAGLGARGLRAELHSLVTAVL